MFTVMIAAMAIAILSGGVTLIGCNNEEIRLVKTGMIGLCASMALYGASLAIAVIISEAQFPPMTIADISMAIGLVAMGLAMALGGGQQIVAIAKIK